MPAAINSAARMAEWCAGFGRGGRAERASVTGTRATARPGHQAAAVAPRTATRTTIASSGQGTLSRSMRWSTAGSSVGATASQSAKPTTVPINAPIAPTTAPLVSSTSRRCFSVAPIAASMPSWRSRRCAITAKPAAATSVARSRKTVATENIASASAARLLCRASDPANADRSPAFALHEGVDPGVDRFGAGIDQHRDLVRCPGGRGRDERELVAQIAWVLDDADDGPAAAVEGERLPELEPEDRGHAVGDGDLARACRVAASAQRKPCAPVGSARVLGAELDLVDAARHEQRAVTDDLDRPEAFLDGGQTRLQPARIGAVEPQQVTGRAELGIVRRARVVGDRDAGDRGRDRDGEKSEHQDLLAPLAPEQAPRPAHERAARGDSAAARSSRCGAVRECRHRR